MDATSIEEIVTESWCEVLSVSDATPDENFFVSGGHSFAAVELMAKVQAALSIEFPFELFLTDGTLRTLIDECVRRTVAAAEAAK